MKKKYTAISAAIFLMFPLLIHADHINNSPDWIIKKPVIFNDLRKALTSEYAEIHYGISEITIKPLMIVVHYTACNTLKSSFNTFNNIKIHNRKYLKKYGDVNVSVHYLVDKDGTVYQLMPDNIMARHVIGLNHCSIGIENVGKNDLTQKQLKANMELIRYLKNKYPDIEYLIGHYEYRIFEKSALFIEKIPDYRTIKHDPGKVFMQKLRKGLSGLKLKSRP